MNQKQQNKHLKQQNKVLSTKIKLDLLHKLIKIRKKQEKVIKQISSIVEYDVCKHVFYLGVCLKCDQEKQCEFDDGEDLVYCDMCDRQCGIPRKGYNECKFCGQKNVCQMCNCDCDEQDEINENIEKLLKTKGKDYQPGPASLRARVRILA